MGSPGGSEIIVEGRSNAKQLLAAAILVVLISVATFFHGLGDLALIGPDEPRYARIAQEMAQSGNLISPRLCGCLWLEKPPLYYWLAALSYTGLGVSEFSARLPSALLALGVALALLGLGGSGSLGGITVRAALVLCTSVAFIGFGRAASTDMPLSAAISLALICSYRAIQGPGSPGKWWLLAGASTGLALLAKGMVGIVLFVGIVTPYWLIVRKTVKVRLLDLGLALPALILVSGVWYLPATLAHGRAFIDEFIVGHHFSRYLTERYQHPQPIYFFPFVALMGIFPWAFFLIPAAARVGSLFSARNPRNSLLLFAWIWVLVPIAFFSLSESKLPGYVLPIFPGMALLVAAELERIEQGPSRWSQLVAMVLTSLMVLVIGVGLPIYLRSEGVQATGWRWMLQWLPLAVALSGAVLLRTRPKILPATVASVVAASIAVIVLLAFPVLNDRLSLKELSLKAGRALQGTEVIAFYIKREYAPVFYANGRVECEIGPGDVLNALSIEELIPALEARGSLIVITNEWWLDDLLDHPDFSTSEIGRQGTSVAVRVLPATDGKHR